MKLLAIIREKDVDPTNEQLPDEAHVNYREAAKCLLFDDDKNIGLIHYAARDSHPTDSYYLPGGGVEVGETILDTLRRELLEEAGCTITDIEEIGYTIQYMSRHLGKQKTYIFSAKVVTKGKPQLTAKEAEEGMEVRWYPLEKAKELILNGSERNFARHRSLLMIDEFKKLNRDT